MRQYLRLAREARAIDQTTADPTDLVVPVEALTDLERHVIEVGRHARPDGTFPAAMRPWFGPPDRTHTVVGVEIPAGWPATGWANRLTRLSSICVKRQLRVPVDDNYSSRERDIISPLPLSFCFFFFL